MRDTLEIVLLILSVVAATVGLIRTLVIGPLDKKLEAHGDRMLLTIERRFLDSIFRRMDSIESVAQARSRQSILWAKALRDELAEHDIKAPDPEMYRWEAPYIGPEGGMRPHE